MKRLLLPLLAALALPTALRADEPVVPHFSGLQVVDLTEP